MASPGYMLTLGANKDSSVLVFLVKIKQRITYFGFTLLYVNLGADK